MQRGTINFQKQGAFHLQKDMSKLSDEKIDELEGSRETLLGNKEVCFSVLRLHVKCSKYWICSVFSLFLFLISLFDSIPRS